MSKPDFVEVYRISLPIGVKDLLKLMTYIEKIYKKIGYDEFYMDGCKDEHGRDHMIVSAKVFPLIQNKENKKHN